MEAMMLHWPDPMMEYRPEKEAILFSNDAFGQHMASEHMYNDLVVQSELFEEATKYYANILTPSSPLVTKKINEVIALNLPVKFHPPEPRRHLAQKSAADCRKISGVGGSLSGKSDRDYYDTMWDGTERWPSKSPRASSRPMIK